MQLCISLDLLRTCDVAFSPDRDISSSHFGETHRLYVLVEHSGTVELDKSDVVVQIRG